MTEKRKSPALRFRGYTDDWEQRKLGELCNITTGKLDANAMVSDGQYDFYTSGIDVFKIDVAAFEGPAITIAGNGASVGYMHLADGKFNAYQRTYVLTDFLADRQFLNVAIGNELPNKIQEEVRGSGIPYIVLNMLTDLAIPFPSHEEQYAIGEFLCSIDNLITLHQRKLEKLKLVKKSMLEKMFPKNGSSVPEIRFKGFTDDWEQRKLGEYVSITSGEAPSKFEEGTELYVKVDDLNYNDKYVVDTQNKVAEHSTVKRVTKGSVVFPKRGAAIMTNKVRIMGIDSYMDTNMMALTSEKLDSEFLYNIISKEGLYKIADTSTIPQINNKHVEPYDVTIPSLAEQRRIGAYFKQLDHLITLHQRKLKKLQVSENRCFRRCLFDIII